MTIKNYGNNLVKQISTNAPGKILFSSGPYEYFLYNSLYNEKISFNYLKSYSIFVYEKSKDASIKISNIDKEIIKNSVVQVESTEIDISITNGNCSFLIAGTINSVSSKKSVVHSYPDEIYKVKKPWGYELWINGKHPNYALKQIFITQDNKTSLQYHNFKKETNVLFEGIANLHFQKNIETVPYLDATLGDINSVELKHVSSVDVDPLTIHRIEAVSDILLYEVSTPHLDDVIRISDDTNRVDGFISKEHEQK
jgi:mannose-6-phosphate isomerase